MSSKTDRILQIYSRMRRGPVTIPIIQDWAAKKDIKISPRTFYRDLAEIENSMLLEGEKIIVYSGEKNRKVWKIEYSDNSEKLNEFDVNSYLLFKKCLALPLISSRRISLDKIEKLFYQTYSKSRFEELATVAERQIKGSHFYETIDHTRYDKILDKLIWCVQNQRALKINKIEFDYTSLPKSVKTPFLFLPLQLIYHRGVLHIAGSVKGQNLILVLAINQIVDYQLTNEMFSSELVFPDYAESMKNRFGITQNIDSNVYDIEIEFSETTAEFICSQQWHETQEFKKLANGNCLMTMHCGINRELIGWLFMWMSNCKVKNPPILKKMFCEKLKEMCKIYDEECAVASNNIFSPN